MSPAQVWQPSILPEDHDSILVLAGDLWRDNLTFKDMPDHGSWIAMVAKRFEHVIIVLGNHDYWGLSLQSAVRKAKEGVWALSNVTVLEQDTVTVSGIKFLGGTLWTDYGRNDTAMMVIRGKMNDYKRITFGDSRVRRKSRPLDMFEIHRQTTKFIFNNCQADFPEQPVIIVTHMAPSEQSIDPAYAHEHILNHAYYTDLAESVRIHCKSVKLWIHGHIHWPVDYSLYNVRVVSNPRGYEIYEGTYFQPNHQLRISEL